MSKIKDNVKKAYEGFKKFLKSIANGIKFFASTVGFIVAVILIVLFCVLVVSVVLRALEHGRGQDEDENYAGISTEGDYEVIVSSVGYAGYDTFITEQLWQEYMAYEYAVLMDVATYLWEGQNAPQYTTLQQAYLSNGTIRGTIQSPTHMPYLPVTVEYDQDKLTRDFWLANTVQGQNWGKMGFKGLTPAGAPATGLVGTAYQSYGGSIDKTGSPLITFEYSVNAYEEEEGSLVPYITVKKFDGAYHYYTVQGDINKRDTYFPGNSNYNAERGAWFHDIAQVEADVNLMEFNTQLNLYNQWLFKSSNMLSNYLNQNSSSIRLSATNTGNYIKADQSFGVSLYYAEGGRNATYKIPLRQLIDRYLPKASLLTSWYLVKDADVLDDAEGSELASTNMKIFDVYDLMQDIKAIYNYYCWGEEDIDQIEVASVQYNEDGTVQRDSNTGDAVMLSGDKNFATTDKHTFLNFGQVGLEYNKYGLYKVYQANSNGPNCPTTVTHQQTGNTNGEVIPIVTDLVSEEAWLLEDFKLAIEYDYTYEYEVPQEKEFTINGKRYGGRKGIDSVNENKVWIDEHMIMHVPEDRSELSYYRQFDGVTIVEVSQAASEREKPWEDRNWRIIYQEGGNAGIVQETDTLSMEIPYSYDAIARGNLHELIYKYMIQEAEKDAVNIPPNMVGPLTPAQQALQAAQTYTHGQMEPGFINYEYIIRAIANGDMYIDQNSDVRCAPVTDVNDYDQDRAYYDFTIDPSLQDYLDDTILAQWADFISNPNVRTALNNLATADALSKAPPNNMPSYGIFLRIVSIDAIRLTGYAEDPRYVTAYDKGQAFYDIKEEIITLTLQINEKRVPCLIVTSGESWSKQSIYTTTIHQNPFEPSKWQYVMPHSYYGFGVVKFNIDVEQRYRTDVYTKYFSKIEPTAGSAGSEPGIKESDVLSMLMTWEDFAEQENETGYVFMRDLYKLIMYIREKGGILENAYSYLYIPDTIWSFDEGLTQEEFWTERLATEAVGIDAMTEEEQRHMMVRNAEPSWQIVDYYSLDECQTDTPGTAPKIYALFAHGNPYIRTAYSVLALEGEKKQFNDGAFDPGGHAAVDWLARSTTEGIIAWHDAERNGTAEAFNWTSDADLAQTASLSGEAYVYKKVYDYSLARIVLRNILEQTENPSAKNTLLETMLPSSAGGSTSNARTLPAYESAVQELGEELAEYRKNSPLVASAPGIVTKAEYTCYSGFHVRVVYSSGDPALGNGLSTVEMFYAHMKRWPNVNVGDIVGPGSVLGYEGNTGNSGIEHLHLSIKIGGEFVSPSAYMAPVFSPFYNYEKALETIEDIEAQGYDRRFMIASEYYSLIRTVLLEQKVLKTAGRDYYDPLGTDSITGGGTPPQIMLEEVRFSGDPNGNVSERRPIYIVFTANPSSGLNMGAMSGDGMIVKVAGEYWYCKIDGAPTFVDPSMVVSGGVPGVDPLTTILSGDSTQQMKYKVIARPQNLGSSYVVRAPIDSMNVVVNWGVTEAAPVKWGNNVPLYPLFNSAEDAFDINVLSVEKIFARPTERDILEDVTDVAAIEAYRSFYRDASGDESEGDVRALPDYFDMNSLRAIELMTLPAWMLVDMSYLDNEYTVPFYDGLIREGQVFDPNGIAGAFNPTGASIAPVYAAPNDLYLIQKSFKNRRLDKDDLLDPYPYMTSYDSNMGTVVEYVTTIITSAGYGAGAPPRQLGDGDVFQGQIRNSVAKVVSYNALMQYGLRQTAYDVSELALEKAFAATGIEYAYLASIATLESGFIPTNESHKAIGASREYDYYGRKIIIRRAQGLMQMLAGNAEGYARRIGLTTDAEILEAMTTPELNAMMGADELDRNMGSLESTYKTWLNAVASSRNWQNLSKECGLSAKMLVKYVTAAEMYNKGPGGVFNGAPPSLGYSANPASPSAVDQRRHYIENMWYEVQVNQRTGKKTYTLHIHDNTGACGGCPKSTDYSKKVMEDYLNETYMGKY